MMTDGRAQDDRPEGNPAAPGASGHGDEARDDALWRLLGRAPAPEPVSPYFARRVLREVAAFEAARPPQPAAASAGAFGWLAGLWQTWRRQPLAASACAVVAAALLLAGGAGLTSPYRHARPVVPPSSVANGDAVAPAVALPETDAALPASAPDPITAQDVEVIADLDNLLSREESRLWTEDTARY